jgi:hypothetical protein
VESAGGVEVASIAGRARVVARPTLAPGATGVVIARLRAASGSGLGTNPAFDVTVAARREAPAAAAGRARPRVTRVAFNARCRVEASVRLAGRVREQRFVIVVRDSSDEIAVADTVSQGPLAGPRDRGVVFEPRDPDYCRPTWARAQLYPFFLPQELTRRE